jgi:hypothetical protein
MAALIMDNSIVSQADFSTIPPLPRLWENPGMAGTQALKAILRERLRERLAVLRKSPHAVSKEIGANPGYVRDLLDPEKTSIPGAERLALLAAALATTVDYLLGRVATPEPVQSEISIREVPQAWQGNRDDSIPVLGTGYCEDLLLQGDDGEEFAVERVMLATDHVIRMIERPPALWADRDAYAIYFHGSSMEPRFYQGELGIVNPRRPPSPGDFVVVQLNNGESDAIITVLVKQLIRIAGNYVELHQFNPDRTFRIARRRVSRMHRICGPNELYGS